MYRDSSNGLLPLSHASPSFSYISSHLYYAYCVYLMAYVGGWGIKKNYISTVAWRDLMCTSSHYVPYFGGVTYITIILTSPLPNKHQRKVEHKNGKKKADFIQYENPRPKRESGHSPLSSTPPPSTETPIHIFPLPPLPRGAYNAATASPLEIVDSS
ncbi:hypothetical protein BGX38DRAFT_762861 [Terfezia claveryi]|nr:hypothetical protein BGX38DRAFT_762861 [Terfezia claveryi]